MKVEIDVAESGQSRKVSLSVSAAALSSLDELREDWLPLPDVLGQGQFQVTQLSNGASLTISECNLTREYRSRVEHDAPFVGIVFCMDGEVSLELSGLAEAQSLVAGEFALFGAFGTSLTRTSPGEQQTRTVVVKIPVVEFRRRIESMGAGSSSAAIVASLEAEESFAIRHKMPADMALSLVSLCTCPFTDACRRLFLEGKYLELQSQALARIRKQNPLAAKGADASELERLERVRLLLIENLDDPPSLDELAKVAGLTHTRLNRGFKRQFGSTVFEYLREHRLDRARLLLEQSDISVTQIAHALGFSSSSHFAQAFRAKFGAAPTLYRAEQRRSRPN